MYSPGTGRRDVCPQQTGDRCVSREPTIFSALVPPPSSFHPPRGGRAREGQQERCMRSVELVFFMHFFLNCVLLNLYTSIYFCTRSIVRLRSRETLASFFFFALAFLSPHLPVALGKHTPLIPCTPSIGSSRGAHADRTVLLALRISSVVSRGALQSVAPTIRMDRMDRLLPPPTTSRRRHG